LIVSYSSSFIKNELPNCLRLRAGTAALEFRYPDKFISASYPDAIRLRRRDSVNPYEGYVLLVDVTSFESLDDVVKHMDPGPEYISSTINGYPAGYAHYNSSGNELEEDATSWRIGIHDYYKIPFGNRTFDIAFMPSNLKPDEISGASEMLRSVSLWN